MRDANQEEIENQILPNNDTVLVDVWAPWCGPCRQMRPQIEKAEAEVGNRAKFIGIDADANPGFAAKHAVTGMPTLLLFRQGGVVSRAAGFRDAKQIRAFVMAGHAE